MHLYFYGSTAAPADIRKNYGLIRAVLAQTNLWVSTNTQTDAIQLATEVKAEWEGQDIPLLERMDAFIIDGTIADPEIGFLLAHAMAMKKPTLYLYQRGTSPQIFSRLQQRELPKFIQVQSYRPDQLDKQVLAFLQTMEGRAVREIPRLKFTLRLTTSQDEYLHYKTHNTKTSKADYLRDWVEEQMRHDQEWQHFLRKRRQE